MNEKLASFVLNVLNNILLFTIGACIMFTAFGIAVYAGSRKTYAEPHHYTDQEILEMALSDTPVREVVSK